MVCSSKEVIGLSDESGDAQNSSPWVFLPAHPLVRDGQIVVAYETRELNPGRWALPVFSSEKKLIEQLGDVQPWVKVREDVLLQNMALRNLVPDPVIDPRAERWTPREAAEHEALIRHELGRSG